MGSNVGLTVWVKLKQPPPNDVLYGVVADLAPGSHLTLHNVFIPATGMRWEHWTVQATAIENIEVIDSSAVPLPPPPPPQHPHIPNPNQAQNNAPPPPPGFRQAHTPSQPSPHPLGQAPPLPRHPSQAPSQYIPPPQTQAPPHPPPPAAAPAPPPQRPTLIDPAIVSYGTSSPTPQKPARSVDVETPIKSMLQRAAVNLPSPGSPFIADAGKSSNNITQKLRDASRQSVPSGQASHAPAKSPAVVNLDPAGIESGPQDTPHDGQQDGSKKKVRRGQKGKKQPPPNPIDVADPPPVMNAEVSRNGNDMNGSVKRGKGWRSTPLLQPSPQAPAPPEKPSASKKSRRKQQDDDALGDTTDIADMGDFDFEGELKKFDKKQVFDEIRQGDTTADEDRLVSHNRTARPGTNGGKNLHPTEPVLSPQLQPAAYNSNELDSASDADTELNLANGRSSSKHSVSRTVFPKTKPSRQNSGHVFENKPLAMAAASMSSDMQRTRSTASLVTRTKASSLAASSPQPERVPSPQSGGSATRAKKAKVVVHPHFAIEPHLAPCPTLLPRALETLESATVSTFGLTHDAITESAGRCIAEAALQLSAADSIRRPSRTNTMRGSVTSSSILNDTNEPVTVVFLAGNHAIGARALAAARHLLGRNVRVIAAESLFESAETQDPQVKAQTAILRRMQRGGANIKRGLWRKASSHIKNLAGPPTVIVDALLAGETYGSLLSTNASHSADSQQETREMIDWANRSRAPVLSVGCPSGISGVDGTSTIVEGEPLSVRADKVVALGAPMQGLLKAMELEALQVSVADIGINICLKSDEAVAFGPTGWSVDLKYVESTGA